MTPDEYTVSAWQGWTCAVRQLLDAGALHTDGLGVLVEELKRGHWADDEDRRLPPAVSARRRLLLDELARASAAARGWPEWPFLADLIGPEVPDDLAGLE
ncbi:MAG TPA: hypothetical protein VK402_18110 [Blastococcus sp.]|nr:hypothetical protein [Blastococcus sp.]